MSKVNGTLMVSLINGVKIGGTKSCTLNLNRKNIDTSSKDSGGHTDRIYGQDDWDSTFDGLYDPALVFNIEEMFALLNAKTKCVIEIACIDNTAGALVYRGTALAKNLSLKADAEGAVTISGAFEADGVLVQGTITTS